MNMNDYQNFSKLLTDVFSFYDKTISDGSFQIWWNALRDKEFSVVANAFSAHVTNPDAGQFPPKPANIIKIIDGSTLDNAYSAWTRVEDAIKKIGPYESVVFDDPIIHRVIHEMGGWISFCEMTDDELPFRAKEFQNRYQGYKTKSEKIYSEKKLVGIIESHNKKLDAEIPSPILSGDEKKCAQVFAQGVDKPSGRRLRLSDIMKPESVGLINKYTGTANTAQDSL